ncbi:VOC family protein [Burkholderia pseudomultivorans]|uniref:VOC family protein n=1 Tax=Burkholderia pseudomultivorans TaxID=1207504 RepID=UPI002875B75D|nr:VOC family protein [Burkholderia pseudomultivorans]MDS0859643.1 VOC family protein [Burkholderia pseudomultivorans]
MTTETSIADQAFSQSPRPQNPGLTPQMLNHAAYVTHDVAATADFYTRIMGMELASTVFDERIPSTGDDIPYFHIFFRMADGSTIAFFEAPGIPLPSKSSHLAYDIFNHIALQARDREEVMAWYEWLKANNVPVIGPTDHKGLILSIYFHDPSGHRLEITTPLDKQWNRHTDQGYRDLAQWVNCKEAAQREGRDVATALRELIRETRKRYA